MNAEEYLKGLNEHDPVFEIYTEYEFTEQQLINFAERYHEKQLKLLGIGGVSVSLPNTEQAESFLIECDLYPHTNQSLKVMTEDGEGAYLDKKDIAKLIECLTVYIGNER